MGRLFDKATQRNSLERGWRQIRANGFASTALETRQAVEQFDRNVLQNLVTLQKRVRDPGFNFEAQKGVLKRKSSGGFRGIVMAPVSNRIVERSILDTLQDHSCLVRRVNTHPHSIGGVPQRSVPHGLKLLQDAFDAGHKFFVRSDISSFFDGIARTQVIDKILNDTQDHEFVKLLHGATTVTLSNEKALGEDRKVFPTSESGVAQGSPLSPLFGNILLHDFDNRLNGRDVICIRFVDDFIILSDNLVKTRKAFESAMEVLAALSLRCHNPYEATSRPDKASSGCVTDGFDFLGYSILPGLLQPSRRSRQNLLGNIASPHFSPGGGASGL